MNANVTPAPAVEIIGLNRSFTMDNRSITILNGINLNIYKGEMVGVVGFSGAGKSTLLHVIGTLDKPTSGRVLHNGQDVFAMREAELAKFRSQKIGFVFQAHHLLPEFSAVENVAVAAMIAGTPKNRAVDAAKELLSIVGLSHRLHHRPGKLSGGEQQRVAIARALVNQPDLLLADEPTGNLDTGTGDEVFELLLKMNRELSHTSVIVTHNLALTERMTRVIRIKDGRISDEELDESQPERE